MVVALIGQTVNQAGITMESEHHRLVDGEQLIERRILHAVRMLIFGLQRHQIHHVDHAHAQFRQVFAQQIDRRQRLHRRHVARTDHHHIRLLARLFSARPRPDAHARLAVFNRLIHRQPLRLRLLASDNHVNAIPGFQAVIAHPQQGIGVRRQIDAYDIRFFVSDVIDKAGVLMAVAIMVLAPDVGGEQIVQRRDRLAPRQLARHLEPFGVLVEHRIDDMNKSFIAVKQAVTTG